MSAEGKRVVLVKPGDVLLIGNVGSNINHDATAKLLGDLKELLDLGGIAVFDVDIDIDVVAAPVPHPAATDPSDGGGGRGAE